MDSSSKTRDIFYFGFDPDFDPDSINTLLSETLFDIDQCKNVIKEAKDPANWVFRFELVYNSLVTQNNSNPELVWVTDWLGQEISKFDDLANSFAFYELTNWPPSFTNFGQYMQTSGWLKGLQVYERASKSALGKISVSSNWKKFRFYSDFLKFWGERAFETGLSDLEVPIHYRKMVKKHGLLSIRFLWNNFGFWNSVLTMGAFFFWAIASFRDRKKPLSGLNPLLLEDLLYSTGLAESYWLAHSRVSTTVAEAIALFFLLGEDFWSSHNLNEEDLFVKVALSKLRAYPHPSEDDLVFLRKKPQFYHEATLLIFEQLYKQYKEDLAHVIHG